MNSTPTTISISRTQSNYRDPYVTIQIGGPGERRIVVRMEIEEFGYAILGLAAQPCTVEVRDPSTAEPPT